MDVLGELADVRKLGDVGLNRVRLDNWNASADNLGILLGLGVAMI